MLNGKNQPDRTHPATSAACLRSDLYLTSEALGKLIKQNKLDRRRQNRRRSRR